MKKNILVDDYVLVESFIKISYAIESLYHKLYTLETRGLKKSKEYNKYLGYLEMATEYEEELYKESKLTAFKCCNLTDLIINRYINKKMQNDLESVVSRKYENAYIRRVINKLNNIMVNDYFGMRELLFQDIFEIGENVDFDSIFYDNMIKHHLRNDYVDRIILFLQEKINETKDVKIKNKLIRDKYYISFIFPIAERNLKENNYNGENIICDNTKIISYISGVKEESYNKIRNDYLEKEIRKLFYKTLYKESEEKSCKERIIIRECLIRALFMMMDKELITSIKKEINDVSNTNYENIKKIFNNSVIYNKEDKKKQITLKLW